MRGGSHLVGLLQGPLYYVLATFSSAVFLPRLPLLSAVLPFCVFTGVMTSRQTNTSQEAALFGIPSSVAASTTASQGTTSSAASRAPAPNVAASSGPSSGLPVPFSPDLAAFISQAVQAAVQSHFAASPAQPVSSSAAVLAPPASLAASSVGGVPAPLSSLTSSFLDSGAGFQSSPAATQGRPPPFVVPSFVSTFTAPLMSTASPPALASSSLAAGTSQGVAFSTSNAATFLADQPFVVGPGFSPVPAKLVNQIVAGKYIDLSELLAANLDRTEQEPQLLLDGRLVLTAPPKRQRRKIEDIAAWVEAFTIFSLVLTSFFPHRWKDLTLYKLLILHTHRHFNGRVWRSYDQAFREHAAASKLVDWSVMDAQLFNFHAAGSSARSRPSDSLEPTGSSSSRIPCMSWNKGRCTAPYMSCRYAHRCSTCAGTHRSLECRPEKPSRSEGKRRSSSPSSSSKFRR